MSPEHTVGLPGIPGVDRRHRPSDFYHERTNFQFMAHMKRYLIISVTVVVLSLGGLFIRGLNLGIDFKGGVSWEVKTVGVTPTIAAVRTALTPAHLNDAKVTILSAANGGKSIRVQAKLLHDPIGDINDALAKAGTTVPANVTYTPGTDGSGTFVVTNARTPDAAAAEKALAALGVKATATVDGKKVTVTVAKVPASPQTEVTDALAKYAHTTVGEVTLNTVGPTWGKQVSHKALEALIVFFIVLALYLAIRFEPKMSAAAIVAVLHDIAFTVGVYAIVGFPVTPATVTAFLTILGFSLYDTVVVFDKIRENSTSLATMGRSTYSEMANRSLNQVLMRSISTSLVALLPVVSLLVVGSFILGATSLEEFALALFAGLFIGTYSSLFVAAPLLVWMKEREPQYKAIKERRARQAGGAPVPPTLTRVPATVPAGGGGEVEAGGDATAAEPDAIPASQRGVAGPPAVGRTQISPITPRARQQRGRKRK